MARTKPRPYKPRVNHGGNFCGHNPDAPSLDLVRAATAPGKIRPKILSLLQERMRRYFHSPGCLPSLRAANQSPKGRQQRSERREACLQLLAAILEFTDLASLRCGIPSPEGFQSLKLDVLVSYTGLHPRRAERAMADLKRAGLITVAQPRQLQEDGTWRGLAAVKAVNRLLFGAFGLLRRLGHEQQRATARLAKKAQRAGGTLTSWARNAIVYGQLKPKNRRKKPAPGDDLEMLKARSELLQALHSAYPNLTDEERRAKADQIIADRANRAIRQAYLEA